MERGYASITEERSRNMMEFLADDLLEGRDAGMRGGQLAARYITSLLREWGVAPLPGEWNKQGNEKLLTNLSYMQPFDVAQLTKPDRGPWQVHPDSIAKVKERGAHRLRHLNNLLAYIPGKRTDEWVIVGAHTTTMRERFPTLPTMAFTMGPTTMLRAWWRCCKWRVPSS